jgi:C-terminal processing protease CtpA/Prc
MELTRFISSESLAHRLAVLETYFQFYLWLVYEWEDPYEIAFTPPEAEQTLTASIAGLPYGEIQRRRSERADRGSARSFAFHPDPETKTGVLDVTQFSAQEEFALFLSETFAEIRDQRFDRLIIDLRQNGGGSTNVSNELLRYITDEPVRNFARYDLKVSRQIKRYLKQQAPRWMYWLPLQYFFSEGRLIWGAPEGTTVVMEGEFIEPGDPALRFSGDLFVFVGPRTFSTAADFAAVVKDFGLGTLVGEETGGLACSFGDTYPFRLPNSQIEVRTSYKYFIRPSGEITEGGIQPDHRMLETAADVAAGRDAAMELARQLPGRSDGAR